MHKKLSTPKDRDPYLIEVYHCVAVSTRGKMNNLINVVNNLLQCSAAPCQQCCAASCQQLLSTTIEP